ncbi:MAG TPA: VWA domain-containing protein [Clostridiaceae bacterium]|nr:VWA domain-containing protein [Clostridiaceae bacterium]
MIFHYPLGFLALLAVPIIILLYLLKQKHENYIISSLHLWQNALQDMEANAPWQKLRKNLLMFLQIFAVVLLALILSEPFIRSGKSNGGEIMLVMDCSLSMQSTDMKPSRFEAAKRDALELIESSQPGTKFSLIASGSTPYIVLHNVDDKKRVMQELNALIPSDTAEDPEGTVELVNSLIRENSEIQVKWFGDGANPMPGSRTEYYSYNRNGNNFAITLLSHRKLQNSREITALSRIANFSQQSAELDVSLYADGNFFDARRITVDAGESENIYWTGIPETVSKLECRIDTKDILEKDNYAGIIISSNKVSKVLLATEKNIFLEKVLSLMPNIELFRTGIDDINELKGYDLYIYDSSMPEELPEDGHIILFNPPGNKYFSSAGKSEYTNIQFSKHSLFNNLDSDSSFSALKADLYQLPVWANPLMENDSGVTAFEGYLDKIRIMVFGFDLHETNLPVKPYFPVIMTRIVQELLPESSNSISAVNAGDQIELSIDPEAEKVYVVFPDGNRKLIAPPFPAAAFNETTQIGIYTLEQELENSTLRQQFFVNAPSEKENATAKTAKGIEQNGEMEQNLRSSGGWSLKTVLLWLLLLILLIEWWVYANGIAI